MYIYIYINIHVYIYINTRVRASVCVCQFVCGWLRLPLGARRRGSVSPSTSLPGTDLFMYVREMENNSWYLRLHAPEYISAYRD